MFMLLHENPRLVAGFLPGSHPTLFPQRLTPHGLLRVGTLRMATEGVQDQANGVDPEKLAGLLKPLSNSKRLSLLLFLREPRYLEEVASHLKVTRQAASEHVEALHSIGLVRRRASERPGKRVVEFVLATDPLYQVHEYFEQLVVQITPRPGDPFLTQAPSPRGVAPNRLSPGAPVLTTVHGIQLGRQFVLGGAPGRSTWTIGRESNCDARLLHDTYVSGRHAEVRRGSGTVEFLVVDTFSRNGTLLNWEPVPPGEPKPLRHGDLVGVGRSLLLFWNEVGKPAKTH